MELLMPFAANYMYIHTVVCLPHFGDFALSDTKNYELLALCHFLLSLFLSLHFFSAISIINISKMCSFLEALRWINAFDLNSGVPDPNEEKTSEQYRRF
jgi:hypothetical protein